MSGSQLSAESIPWAQERLKECVNGDILVLGGGWVGTSIARHSPDRVIMTHRDADKVKCSQAAGLQAVVFSLEDEATWANLPESFGVVIITFALGWSTPGRDKVQRLYARLSTGTPQLIRLAPPIIVLSTTSVFGVPDVLHATVDEESPLTGVGVTGKSQEDRVQAEQWLLGKGAAVLALSGLVGPGREVSNIINRARPNGAAGVNLVHVDDVCAVVRFVAAGMISGERIIVSSGSYKYSDLAAGLGLEPLPEVIGELLPKQTKRVSFKRLLGLLPREYYFTLPVDDCLPVEDQRTTIHRLYSTH